MKDTIKANFGYVVKHLKNTDEVLLKDGVNVVMVAKLRTYNDYLEEKDDNECFCFCEKFTTVKGNEFIYWRDEEIDTDYLTKL